MLIKLLQLLLALLILLLQYLELLLGPEASTVASEMYRGRLLIK